MFTYSIGNQKTRNHAAEADDKRSRRRRAFNLIEEVLSTNSSRNDDGNQGKYPRVPLILVQEAIPSEGNDHANKGDDDDTCRAVDVAIRDCSQCRATEDAINDAEASNGAQIEEDDDGNEVVAAKETALLARCHRQATNG